MNRSLFLRKSFCLLLALILCAGCVIRPLEARASMLGTMVGVSAALFAGSCMIGLGFSPSSTDTSVFDSIASSIAYSLSDVYENTLGELMVNLISLDGSLYAPSDLVSSVLDGVNAADLVSYTIDWSSYVEVVGSTPSYTLQQVYERSLAHSEYGSAIAASTYALCIGSSLYFSNSPFIVTPAGSSNSLKNFGTVYHCSLSSSKLVINKIDGWDGSYPYAVYQFTPSVVPVASTGLALNVFGAVLSDVAYKAWNDSAISHVIPGGDDDSPKKALPIGLASVAAGGIAALTQTVAQAGGKTDVAVESTGETVEIESSTVPGTGTTAGVTSDVISTGISGWWTRAVTDVQSWATSITDAIAIAVTAVQDFFKKPEGEIGSPSGIPISLKSFFPFCIPYDLKNMLDPYL